MGASLQLIFIYTTVPSKKVGHELAKHLLSKKLVACANIGTTSESFYRWNGKIQKDREYPIFFKAPARNWKKINSEIIKLHPYKCPCIVAMPVTKVDEGYAKWVFSVTEN